MPPRLQHDPSPGPRTIAAYRLSRCCWSIGPKPPHYLGLNLAVGGGRPPPLRASPTPPPTPTPTPPPPHIDSPAPTPTSPHPAHQARPPALARLGRLTRQRALPPTTPLVPAAPTAVCVHLPEMHARSQPGLCVCASTHLPDQPGDLDADRHPARRRRLRAPHPHPCHRRRCPSRPASPGCHATSSPCTKPRPRSCPTSTPSPRCSRASPSSPVAALARILDISAEDVEAPTDQHEPDSHVEHLDHDHHPARDVFEPEARAHQRCIPAPASR